MAMSEQRRPSERPAAPEAYQAELSCALAEAYGPPALLVDAELRVLAASRTAERLLALPADVHARSAARFTRVHAGPELWLPRPHHEELARLFVRLAAGAGPLYGALRSVFGSAQRVVLRCAAERPFHALVCFESPASEAVSAGAEANASADALFLFTRDGALVSHNAAGERLLPGFAAAAVGAHLRSLLDPAFLRTEWPRLRRELVRTGAYAGELRLRVPGDGVQPVWASLRAVPSSAGPFGHFQAVVPDLDAHASGRSQLARLAFYDALTGLPNRRLFREHVKAGLRRAERHHAPLAVLLVDLDRVKAINDTLGRDAGDELLRQAAQRLSRELRASDVLARVAGDDFGAVLEDVESVEDATRVCQKVLAALTRPFRLLGQDVFCGAVLGVALFPDAGRSESALFGAAESALAQARSLGRNKYVFYRLGDVAP
jgi:diguanylate cyclase (GGDEF)-like protein